MKKRFLKADRLISIGLLLLVILSFDILSPQKAYSVQKVSLKKYPLQSLLIKNPVDLTRLPKGKTFQINDPHFVLQFFFNENDIFGMVFKRDKHFSIKLRWCFFRSCEESPYDYSVVIAQPSQPPFADNFFSVNFPARLNYHFQGLDFSSPP